MSTAILRCSLGDLALLSGYLRLSVRGNWVAFAECAEVSVPVGACSILIAPEQLGDEPPREPDVFAGWVQFADAIEGSNTLTVEIVGGAGQLLNVLGPDDTIAGVTDIPAGVVLAALVKALGEQLAAGVEQALDAYTLPRWHRAGGTTGKDAIDTFVDDLATATGLELGWRVLADGTIWAGLETWTALDVATVGAEYAGQVTTDATVLYAPSGAPLRPGTTITSTGPGGTLATRAVEVLYTLVPPALRARVRHTMPGDPPFAPRLELYARTWPATTAAAQNADGTVDVTCDDARMGDLRSVPLRLGLPGSGVLGLPKGARVRVAFEGASPRAPFAFLADMDPAADARLALVGQTIGYLTATAPPGGGPCVLAISPVPVPNSVKLANAGPGHKYVIGVSGP